MLPNSILLMVHVTEFQQLSLFAIIKRKECNFSTSLTKYIVLPPSSQSRPIYLSNFNIHAPQKIVYILQSTLFHIILKTLSKKVIKIYQDSKQDVLHVKNIIN